MVYFRVRYMKGLVAVDQGKPCVAVPIGKGRRKEKSKDIDVSAVCKGVCKDLRVMLVTQSCCSKISTEFVVIQG